MSKFVNLPIWEISDPKNSKNFQFTKQFQYLPFFGISMVFQINKIEACQNLLSI